MLKKIFLALVSLMVIFAIVVTMRPASYRLLRSVKIAAPSSTIFANQTDVTWSMSGNRNFMSKAVCLFMNMDKLIGGDFEKGLAKLKTDAEAKK